MNHLLTKVVPLDLPPLPTSNGPLRTFYTCLKQNKRSGRQPITKSWNHFTDEISLNVKAPRSLVYGMCGKGLSRGGTLVAKLNVR
jgi:hypothetical protein